MRDGDEEERMRLFDEQPEWLTVTQAAIWMRKTRRTIETWIASGLMVTEITIGKRMVRYIRLSDLQAHFRGTLPKIRNRQVGEQPTAERIAAQLSAKYVLDNDFTPGE